MILLQVAQARMAIAADKNQFVAAGAAGNVMKLQRQRIVDTRTQHNAACSYPIAPTPSACDARDSIRDRSWVNSFKRRCGRCVQSSGREPKRADRARLVGSRMGASVPETSVTLAPSNSRSPAGLLVRRKWLTADMKRPTFDAEAKSPTTTGTALVSEKSSMRRGNCCRTVHRRPCRSMMSLSVAK